MFSYCSYCSYCISYCIHMYKEQMALPNDKLNTSQPTVVKFNGCSSALQINNDSFRHSPVDMRVSAHTGVCTHAQECVGSSLHMCLSKSENRQENEKNSEFFSNSRLAIITTTV